MQSRIGETTGTLHRALKRDEEKLSHRIHGFLGLAVSLLSFVCQEETKKRKPLLGNPEKQGENSRCSGTMVLRVRQKTEPAWSAGKINFLFLFIVFVLRESKFVYIP